MDDYVVNFQRDYRYFYSDAGIVFNLDTRDRVRIRKICEAGGSYPLQVGPNVDGYYVYPELIIGHVSKSREKVYVMQNLGDSYKLGYFIIDLRNDRRYNGLSRKVWIERLRKFGVNHEPRLFKPSRFDEYLGRNKPQPLPD